ncbi:MAG: hypothetical protein IID13_10400 [Candidatus Marinimicrobia bacterium]|nr:hypothetical protein [Candidatus Neomarinimicrobiota bacterium]
MTLLAKPDPVRRIIPGPLYLLLLTASLSWLVAQDDGPPPQGEPTEIYRLVYQAALADSVITPDEQLMLETLQQALGLHRNEVDQAVGEVGPLQPPRLQSNGRWTLMAQNMAWGVGLYGWGIPFVLDVQDFKWYIGSEMFSLGGALYLTWQFTEGLDLPESRSQMQRFGGLVGLHYGVALGTLVKLRGRSGVFLLMAAVPTGSWVGDRLYRSWRPSTGQAYALALHGELGRSVMGQVYRAAVAQPKEPANIWYGEDYKAYERDLDDWSRLQLVFQVSGYPVGLYLGRRYYGQRQYSFGDAMMLTLGRGGGALYGLLLADLAGLEFGEQDNAWRWVTIGGGLSGLVGMDRYIQGWDYTFGQAAIMALGGAAGGAFALGFGFIIEAEGDFFEVAAIVGSLAGFGLTRTIVSPAPEYLGGGNSQKAPNVELAISPLITAGSILPALSVGLRW